MSASLDTQHPEVAQHFMRAYVRGLRGYYHAINKGDADRGPVVQALVDHTPIKDPEMYVVMGLPSMDPNGTWALASWSAFQTYFVERGMQRQSLNLAPYVDPGPLAAAFAIARQRFVKSASSLPAPTTARCDTPVGNVGSRPIASGTKLASDNRSTAPSVRTAAPTHRARAATSG